jgi:glucose-1-phosphate cytidylyltransferase
MKVVILAGGFGTRICEESYLKPKPMIEIGGNPILWHIMKYYSFYGYHEFIICAGYKQHVIKEYFANYYLYRSNVTFDFGLRNAMIVHDNTSEPWKVTIVDTGLNTKTGGRIKRIQKYIGNETFLLTYGDGLCDVPIDCLVTFHQDHQCMVTLTAIQPGGRFGTLDMMEDGKIKSFSEKKKEDGGWINGGYMVLEPSVFDIIHYFTRLRNKALSPKQ